MRNKLTHYFNIMANIIFETSKFQFSDEDISSCFENEHNEAHKNIATCFSELIMDNNINRRLEYKELNESFFDRIQGFVSKNRDNVWQILLLLSCMDTSIVQIYDNLQNYETEFECVESLNNNFEETNVIIYRKLSCSWENKTQSKCSTSINDNIMYNFYYIDKSKINDAQINSFVMDRNLMFSPFKDNIRIGISPLTKDKTLKINGKPYSRKNQKTNDNQYFFNIEEILNEKDIEAKIESNILTAGKKNIDILVFPEMIGTEGSLENIQKFLMTTNKEKPKIIIFPSIWKKSQNNIENSNASVVLWNDGQIIFKQYKRIRYRYQDKKANKTIYEDINCEKSNIINILHIPKIGRVCIAICYDYLKDENREMLLNNLKPTLILSPSFSQGSHNFNTIKEYSFSKSCNWVWCNSCSALNIDPSKKENFNIIGIITKFSKKSNALEQLFPGINCCLNKDCANCVYYTDISLTENYREVPKYDVQ